VAQLQRLQALADERFAPVAQLAGDPEEEELVQGKFASSEVQPQRQKTPRANNRGLPDQLKSGIESLSGLSMDHVRVHDNSLQPAQLNARGPRGLTRDRARNKAKACAVTQQKPIAADRNPIELEAHHLFDSATRPDLAALDDNLLVISSALHRNFHRWMGSRPCEPRALWTTSCAMSSPATREVSAPAHDRKHASRS
jgi:hypothetical protein